VVLPTVYAAVERELKRLIAKLDPDAILLFGLAGRSDRLRVETRAVNAASRTHPDAARTFPASRYLIERAPRELFVDAPVRRLLAAARSAGVPARLSRDAGSYVCNASLFLCLDTARKKKRPPLVTFIHIPAPQPRAPRRRKRKGPRMAALVRAGGAILAAVVAEARR
jgi:pyroglutamyl-peptidase